MFWENLKMAFVSLGNAKLRSFLTMLGIIIGVAAVVSITAIGQGVKDSVRNQISGLGSNVLTVTSGSGSKTGKGSTASLASALGASTLTQADAVSVRRVDHVTEAATVSLISGLITYNGVTASDAFPLASGPEYASITQRTMSAGRFLNASDEKSNSIVIGDSIKTEFFGTNDAVGKVVEFRGQKFIVIGVMTKKDSGSSLGGPSPDAFAVISVGTATKLLGQSPSILRIMAQVDSPNNVDAATAGIKASIKKNHGGQDDFSVQTQADILATFSTILNLLTTFIAAIASISLLVGGIGIMNIMLVSVTERTREIGLRKAIGASSSTVLSQFLIEAVVLSLFGGILGIGAAYLLATIGGRVAGITPGFTPTSIMLAVGISALVGIIFGIAPAYKASRLRPIQALKSI